MLTDYDLAEICATLYDPKLYGLPPIKWTHLCEMDGSYCAHIAMPDCDVICWRGSITDHDWLEDLDALPYLTSSLGYVHKGFYDGVKAAWPQVLTWHGFRKLYVIGHSLGAAHAMLHSAMVSKFVHTELLETVVWGEPRPGFDQLASILWPVKTRSYRNRHDPVTEVPKLCDHTGKDLFVHPKPLIPVDVAPVADDFSPLADHHFGLYLKAMEELCGPAKTA